jgi:hypothetical protein
MGVSREGTATQSFLLDFCKKIKFENEGNILSGFRDMNWTLDLLTQLPTPLGTISNYSVITNIHILQITTAVVKPFPSMLCLNQPFPGKGF